MGRHRKDRQIIKEMVLVRDKNHPNAWKNGFVPEHIAVAAKALGHAVPKGAIVHHHDGNPYNNEPSNLVICENTSYHMIIHRRTRMLRRYGDPNITAAEHQHMRALQRKGYLPESQRKG